MGAARVCDMETAGRTSAALAVVVLGILLLGLSWYRLGSALPPPSDCCGCGSLRSPSIPLPVTPAGTVEGSFAEGTFNSRLLGLCEAAYSSRASEVQVTAALGGALLAGGGAVGIRRRTS